MLPPREDLTEWLGAIVERDGLGVLLRALVKSVGRDRFMAAVEKECDIRWGCEPIITGDSGQQVGLQCPPPNAQCRPPPHCPMAGAVGEQLGCALACALDWLVRGDGNAHAVGVVRRAARPRGRVLLPRGVLVLRARIWEGGRDLRGEERARVAQPGYGHPGGTDA